MSAAFGVHFGSTNACLAVCKEGKTEVVANDAGDRVTPAMVAFTDHDKVAGLAAKQGIIRNSANTVRNVKDVLGQPWTELVKYAKDSPVRMVEKGGEVVYQVEYKERLTPFTPLEIVAFIYKKMMETAESHGGAAESHDAVITVPIHFNEQQRRIIRRGAQAGGFNVLRMISEPVAAALAYDIGQKDTDESCNVLIYKLGGTSLELCVIAVCGGMYRVASSHCDTTTGGSVIDKILAEHFASEFQRRWKIDCRSNKRAFAKLHNGAEMCKHILSTRETAQVSVDSLCDGIDFQATVARGRFQSMCSGFLQQCLEPLEGVLKQAGLTKDDIQKVILCGGCTKVPSLQQQLAEYFSGAELLSSIAPDEVIAVGAAKQASILSGLEQSELDQCATFTDIACLSADILIETSSTDGSRYLPVLAHHTPVPVRCQKTFTLAPEQTDFCLHLLQSGVAQPDPETLAKIVMKDLPREAQINAVFHVKSDGSLHVTCTEPTSTTVQDITVDAS
ncbi:Heat shock 70 kDa protein 14 [Lamellibrachia satsuma]|nr:Heat shock 70 kDa protein 14 [Lamellibrachia satsuma]